MRCMRAGAREFLTEPVLPGSVGEALVRAAVRRDEVRRRRRATGKLLVFVGAKGGSGVTTVASNFAVAWRSMRKVALARSGSATRATRPRPWVSRQIHRARCAGEPEPPRFGFSLGSDGEAYSGLAVLGAPDQIPAVQPSKNGIGQLLRVAREDSRTWWWMPVPHSIEMYEALFEMATTVYLVTQVASRICATRTVLYSLFQRPGSESWRSY